MVETVVALLLFLNGNMVEHVYKDNLKQCNESKKIAESVVNPKNVTFVCKEVKAKTIIDDTNNQKITISILAPPMNLGTWSTEWSSAFSYSSLLLWSSSVPIISSGRHRTRK